MHLQSHLGAITIQHRQPTALCMYGIDLQPMTTKRKSAKKTNEPSNLNMGRVQTMFALSVSTTV